MESRFTVVEHGGQGLRLHHTEWGDPKAGRVVVCVHGLTRNARDFDALATALADDMRVLCVDVPGRGRSDRLDDPMHYRVDVYADLLAAWLGELGLPAVAWVGTSMGGLIGMGLAARERTPIRRLVLNDIGPTMRKEALEAIAAYLGLDLCFPTLAGLEAHLRVIHAGFGPLSDAQWSHLARHGAREDADGWRLSYDPRLREAMLAAPLDDVDLWPIYDAVTCPTLLLRGGDSLLLAAATAAAMTTRGPHAEVVTFPGIGHAPALMAEDQIAAIRRFLEAA